MWADNETATDLLGFSVHKDLLLRLVTDPRLLPVTVGVFGDWGGGKFSVQGQERWVAYRPCWKMTRRRLLGEV